MENAAFVTEPTSQQITPETLREIAEDWSVRHGELRKYIYAAADRIETLEATNAKLLEACEASKQFIENGIEFRFIRMPDSNTPDPAHNTLPLIRAAIAAAKGGGE